MAGQVTARFVVDRLEGIRKERIPAFLRAVARDLLLDVTNEGQRQIYGGTLGRTKPNSALSRYYAAAMTANVRGRLPGVVTTGLPKSDQDARILRHRETGGTIGPRFKQFLRVPLPPAITPDGDERYAGIDLKARIGTPGNPFFVYRKQDSSQAVLAKTLPNGALEAWYVLKREVHQQPHPWWTNTTRSARERMPATLKRNRDLLSSVSKGGA